MRPALTMRYATAAGLAVALTLGPALTGVPAGLPGDHRAEAAEAPTRDALRRNGATPLTRSALRRLVVGQTLSLSRPADGAARTIRFGTDRLARRPDGAPAPYDLRDHGLCLFGSSDLWICSLVLKVPTETADRPELWLCEPGRAGRCEWRITATD